MRHQSGRYLYGREAANQGCQTSYRAEIRGPEGAENGTSQIMTKQSGELRLVAIVEGVKGALVLVAAGLFFHLLHGDVQATTEALVRHFHLNPARHNPGVFIEMALSFGSAHTLLLSLGALCYAAVRFVEAYGLWLARSWAWGFGIISGGLYIPLELVELSRRITWPGVTVLTVNALIVLILWRARGKAR